MSLINSIENLKITTRGEVILPGDESYDESRSIWNGMIDRNPAVICKCSGVADVISCVNFARENNMILSVHGKGHNIAGKSVCDNGIMIDLSGMNDVHVNPEKRKALVSPGANLGDVDHETQAFGLATPTGINSTTGISGLTLGGGFGWLTRKHGMTIDNLISAELVTAEGKVVTASENENPDLFWALRGGGGNFGIVTRFEFDLHPVGPEILGGLIVFPFKEAKQVIRRYREYVDEIPEDMSIWVVTRKAPPLPFLPEAVHGREVVILPIFYNGDIDEGIKLVEPVRNFGRPYGEHIGPVSYEQWQKGFDPLLTPGFRNYWKSHNFTQLSDGVIDLLIKYTDSLPTDQCEIFIADISGKANAVPEDATAYSHRNTKFVLNVHSRWGDQSRDEQCIKWARDFFRETSEYATGGVYVNFITEDETDRIKQAYGSSYKRLAGVKKKYDPHNIFKVNFNIVPE